MEQVSHTNEMILTLVKISSERKTHGKTCWWWRKGRCHHGDKCWFEHNFRDTELGRGSPKSANILRKGTKQIHATNLKHISGMNRSPRERERDKGPHSRRGGKVMKPTMRVLRKLGRELKLAWPVDTKRDAVTKLIIAQLRNPDEVKSGSQKHLAKPTT